VAMSELALPVVVGIDGSQAGVDAALWAAQEAHSRGVPLRLIHVVSVDEEDADVTLGDDPAAIAADWPETEYGRTSLRNAATTIHASGLPLTVDTDIAFGDVESTLIDESQNATMICVGSLGIDALCWRALGSTAATLAEQAHAPVAVIRTPPPASADEPDWIVASVDDSPESDAVADSAFREADLRRAPVLALGLPDRRGGDRTSDELNSRVAGWRRAHPSLDIYPVCIPTDVPTFLENHRELRIQLAVIGAADVDQVPAIVGPHHQGRRLRNWCSVLVVR